MQRIAVLGNGGFGTALALHAHRQGHRVRLWGHDHAYTGEIAGTRRNPRYLPDLEIPADIAITSDPGEVLADAELVLSVLPTQRVREVMQTMREALPPAVPIVSCSKGMEEATGLLPTEVLARLLSGHTFFVLTGPCHAEELARGFPTTVVLAGDSGPVLERLQQELSGPTLRLYRSTDMAGAELGAAVKNVIAIAAGICDGLGLGDNAKAALLTRGITEMARFGTRFGARRETFFGLAGIGDLITTSVSRHGRNRALGERIGRGETLDHILSHTRTVAEGVWTCRAVLQKARGLDVPVPITEGVASVLFEGRAPTEVVQDLMTRDLKDEDA